MLVAYFSFLFVTYAPLPGTKIAQIRPTVFLPPLSAARARRETKSSLSPPLYSFMGLITV